VLGPFYPANGGNGVIMMVAAEEKRYCILDEAMLRVTVATCGMAPRVSTLKPVLLIVESY
jgi:hypothetical protein